MPIKMVNCMSLIRYKLDRLDVCLPIVSQEQLGERTCLEILDDHYPDRIFYREANVTHLIQFRQSYPLVRCDLLVNSKPEWSSAGLRALTALATCKAPIFADWCESDEEDIGWSVL